MARSLTEADSRVSFRSSDIEFWSVDDISDVTEMRSAKYGLRSGNVSLEIELPEAAETFAFAPGTINNFDGGDVAFDLTERYNIIRIDIGDGRITFVENGFEVLPENTITSEVGGVNTNSIVLVDNKFLSEPQYLSRDIYRQMQTNNYDWEVGPISETDQPFVEALSSIMGSSIVDMDGGLLLPFQPVDFSEYADITGVTVDFLWDITDAIYESEGTWYFTDRVLGTPFDFQIQLIVAGSAR
jgi:hypothetical protein